MARFGLFLSVILLCGWHAASFAEQVVFRSSNGYFLNVDEKGVLRAGATHIQEGTLFSVLPIYDGKVKIRHLRRGKYLKTVNGGGSHFD